MRTIEELKLFDGEPSFDLLHRPFYSIVIPCYESQWIERLLNSIKLQNLKDDIEVILSDDCSLDLSYLEIVSKYSDDICIKMVKTDYNCSCPGNTREKGVSYASGQWICFADHDDEFIPNTLAPIKKEIIESGEKYLCVANFYNKDPRKNVIVDQMIRTRNWCHAKFFNMDNLWKPFDIHFKKDLLSHEDIYITTYTSCCLYKLKGKDEPYYIDTFCYYWNVEPTSLSRRDYGGREFIEVFYNDYVESTGNVYVTALKKGLISPLFAFENCVATLLYCYFYGVYCMQKRPNDYLPQNIEIARNFSRRIKEIFKIKGQPTTNEQMVQLVTKDVQGLMYTYIRERAAKSTGRYKPFISFKDWLNLLDGDNKI